jgi:hypothetical protein
MVIKKSKDFEKIEIASYKNKKAGRLTSGFKI